MTNRGLIPKASFYSESVLPKFHDTVCLIISDPLFNVNEASSTHFNIKQMLSTQNLVQPSLLLGVLALTSYSLGLNVNVGPPVSV